MSPAGKGVLRIAIEDFLETFGFGKRIKAWIKDLFETWELEAIDVYEKYLNRLEITKVLPVSMQPATLRADVNRHQIELITILLMGVGIVIGYLMGVVVPFQRNAQHRVDAVAKSFLFEPNAIAILLQRGYINEQQAKEIYSFAGVNDDFQTYLRGLIRQYLNANQYVSLFYRGWMTKETLLQATKEIGLNPQDVESLIELNKYLIPPNDLITMGVREVFSPDIVAKFGYDQDFPEAIIPFAGKIGMDADTMHKYWWSHWQLPSVSQVYEMLHRLRPDRSQTPVTLDDMKEFLRIADFSPNWRDKLIAISYNPITRVDVRRMYKLGIFDREEVKQRYMDIGYVEADADKLADFTVKYETSTGEDKDDEIKRLSEAVSKRMYLKGIITRDQYSTTLSKLKYPNDVIALLLQLADSEQKEDLTPDYRKQYISDMTGDIRKSLAGKLISESTARTLLSQIGLIAEQIEFIIKNETYQSDINTLNNTLELIAKSYVNGSIDRNEFIAKLGSLNISGEHQQKIITEVELSLAYRNRRLTESQYRAAAKAGIISIDDYKLALVGLGYPDKDIDILIQLYFVEGSE